MRLYPIQSTNVPENPDPIQSKPIQTMDGSNPTSVSLIFTCYVRTGSSFFYVLFPRHNTVLSLYFVATLSPSPLFLNQINTVLVNKHVFDYRSIASVIILRVSIVPRIFLWSVRKLVFSSSRTNLISVTVKVQHLYSAGSGAVHLVEDWCSA